MRYLLLICLVLSYLPALALCPANPPQTQPPGKSTDVKVGIYVVDIHELNNKTESFKADMLINLSWRDPRFNKGQKCVYSRKKVWTPLVQIINKTFLRSFLKSEVFIDTNGRLYTYSRFLVTIKSPLKLKSFPFDQQTLPINFVPMGKLSNKVKLVFDKEHSGYNNNLSLNGWEVLNAFDSVTPYNIQTASQDSSRTIPLLTYSFNVKRQTTYYWWKVFLPLTLIIFMSWAIFLIEPTQFGPQISLSTTSILTLIAFLFSLQNILPPLSYLTRLDYYIYSSLILVFAAFLNAIGTSVFAISNRLEIARKMDRWCLFIFPTSYLLIVIFFWLI